MFNYIEFTKYQHFTSDICPSFPSVVDPDFLRAEHSLQSTNASGSSAATKFGVMIYLVFTVVDVIGTILAYLNCGSAQQSSFIVPTDRTF